MTWFCIHNIYYTNESYFIYCNNQMKTEVIMKRDFLWSSISQKSKSSFFSLTDLAKTWNQWRLSNWKWLFNISSYLSTKSSKEFVAEVERQFWKAIIKWRWKWSHTRAHPFIFLDVALAMSPTLKVKVYGWLYDSLLKYRNDLLL